MSKYPKYEREIEGVLIDNGDAGMVAVLVNPNDHGMQTQIEMGGRLYDIELPANSIVSAKTEE